jgi:NADP-dependent alcohol dehydrogenase
MLLISIVDRFKERGWLGLGEKQTSTLEKVKINC